MTTVPHVQPMPVPAALSLTRVSYETYRILQCVFVAAPIVAGLDKFFGLLTDWSQYLSPWLIRETGNNPNGFMMIVGAIEIVAGIGVAIKPKYFGYVVALWLCGIIINLLSFGKFYDIALRDLGLAVAAVSLARVAAFYDHGLFGGLMRQKV